MKSKIRIKFKNCLTVEQAISALQQVKDKSLPLVIRVKHLRSVNLWEKQDSSTGHHGEVGIDKTTLLQIETLDATDANTSLSEPVYGRDKVALWEFLPLETFQW